MLVEVRIKNLAIDPRTESWVVVLQETGGERVVPIWIGSCEADAIEMHLSGTVCDRPFTHDLLVKVVTDLGGTLDRVVIDRVDGHTYFAHIFVRQAGGMVKIDARPSDSIAVAIRLGAPIYANDGLLERMPIEITSDPGKGKSPKKNMPTLPGMSGKKLQDYLRKLDPEDFGRFTP